jgi:hypothetical protein
MFHIRLLKQGIIDVQNRATRVAKYTVHAEVLQALDHHFGA